MKLPQFEDRSSSSLTLSVILSLAHSAILNLNINHIPPLQLAVELQQLDGGSSVLHAHVDGKNYDADEKGKGKVRDMEDNGCVLDGTG